MLFWRLFVGVLNWKVAADWSIHFTALLHFKSLHGHCNVPAKELFSCVIPGANANGTDFHYKAQLGDWLRKQRQARKHKRLNQVYEKQLQALSDAGQSAQNTPDRYSVLKCLFFSMSLFASISQR